MAYYENWYDSSDGSWLHLIDDENYEEKELENMPRKRDTVYMHGKVYWAKVFGAPRPNYDGDAREWTLEFEPDAESTAILEEHGLSDRLKDGSAKKGGEGRGKFIYLRRDEFDYEQKPNEHIRVVDAANQPWNDKVLLGNGTEVDIKVNIVDYGRGKKKGIYPQAIRVLELVPYVSKEFDALDENDPRVKKARAANPAATPDFEKDFGIEENEVDTETPDMSQASVDEYLNDDVPL